LLSEKFISFPPPEKSASNDAKFLTSRREKSMRTTINIDDELLTKALKLVGPMDRTALLSESLNALIERESAKRLARLGGAQPELKAAPRRRAARTV
jgi:Arc/MetJ family transcription regulator